MSPETTVVLWVLFFVIYGSTYFWSRKGILKKKKYSTLVFIFNLFLLISIVVFIYDFFSSYKILNFATLPIIITMGLAGIAHHISIILIKKRDGRILNFIHGPLSHTAFFTSLILIIIIGRSELLKTIKPSWINFLNLLITFTIALSIIGTFERFRSKFYEK